MSDAGIKIRDQEAMAEELTNTYNKLKAELGRDPSYAEMIRESGRDKNTIKRNIGNLTFSEGRKVEGAGKKGLEASKEYFKTRKVDKPTYSKIDGKVSLKWPSPEVEQDYIKDLETIYSRPKAPNTNDMLSEKYKIPKAEVERINSVLIIDRNLQYPEADSTGRYKTRRGRLVKNVGPKLVSMKGTPEMQFHHIKQIGGEVPLTKKDVAFISKEMNSRLSPYNKQLNNIADEISDTITASFKAMEAKNEGEALDLLKKVDVLNKEAEGIINNAVETLPKKYKPYIGFNKFFARTDEYGFPLDDKVRVEPIGGGLQKGEIEKPFTKYSEREIIDFKREAEKDLRKKLGLKSQRGFIDPRLLGADKVAAGIDKVADIAKLYGPGAARIAQMTLRGVGTVYPFEVGFMGDMQQQGLSPKEMALDIGTLGLGTIFKDIKEKFDYVKSKGLGDELQSAFRKQTINQQARPTLGGAEGMFQEQTLTPDEEAALRAYNIDAQNIIDMRRSYQADEYRKTDEAFGFDDPILRTGAMGGGIMRLGFADGPEDPSKRKFMKIMGGLASIPIVGKFFKVAEKAAPLINKIKTPDAVGKPEWFDTLVNKVVQQGTDMTKQFATKEREIVHGTKISDDEYVRVVQDLDDDVVRIEYDSPTNVGQDTVVLQVKAGRMDEATGKKPRDEFQASEVEPAYVGGPEDTDMEFVGENSGPGIKFLESDVSNLQQFATGKKLTKEEAAKAKKRKEFVEKINEDNYEAAEHLAGKYGDGPEPDYDDFID